MSLAVLGVSRDQIMGNLGHLTRNFVPHHFQTCRPPQTPPENSKNRFLWIFEFSSFYHVSRPQKRKKGALQFCWDYMTLAGLN